MPAGLMSKTVGDTVQVYSAGIEVSIDISVRTPTLID